MNIGTHVPQLAAYSVSSADREDGMQLPRTSLGIKGMTATRRFQDRASFDSWRANEAVDKTEQHSLATIQNP